VTQRRRKHETMCIRVGLPMCLYPVETFPDAEILPWANACRIAKGDIDLHGSQRRIRGHSHSLNIPVLEAEMLPALRMGNAGCVTETQIMTITVFRAEH